MCDCLSSPPRLTAWVIPPRDRPSVLPSIETTHECEDVSSVTVVSVRSKSEVMARIVVILCMSIAAKWFIKIRVRCNFYVRGSFGRWG